ncbi:hypothetical protein VNO77_44651 [Canavalia gladiata]|uniref:Uncharacterized protein n=1 Tax=Canavalia gladiata TaxID=3824 RepID=A0AAN9PQI6_CANGL
MVGPPFTFCMVKAYVHGAWIWITEFGHEAFTNSQKGTVTYLIQDGQFRKNICIDANKYALNRGRIFAAQESITLQHLRIPPMMVKGKEPFSQRKFRILAKNRSGKVLVQRDAILRFSDVDLQRRRSPELGPLLHLKIKGRDIVSAAISVASKDLKAKTDTPKVTVQAHSSAKCQLHNLAGISDMVILGHIFGYAYDVFSSPYETLSLCMPLSWLASTQRVEGVV